MKNRSYSVLEIRSADDDKRIIEGVATTPIQARDGDILETSGIQYKLPVPFLFRHRDPMGNVVAAEAGPDGIRVRIQVAPAGVSETIDEAWRMVKAGVVRGLSIGWRTLQELYDKEIGGYRILKSEWLELSAVPVPADTNANITSVRSADEADLAALGQRGASFRNRTPSTPPASRRSLRKNTMKTFATQIAELERKRAAHAARMAAIMETADAQGEIADEAQRSEYDGLVEDLEGIDSSLTRLRAHERAVGGAAPVRAAAATDADEAARSRGRTAPAEVTRVELPKGTTFVRSVIALVNARGNHLHAADLASRHYRDTPEVALALRSVVDAGDTTTSGWASQLVPAAQQMQSEFLELLRPATLIGRIPGLRRVPFNVSVPLQTAGGTYGWVGEAKAKPVTSMTFSNATLRWAKASGIVVITRELARFSSPSAEAIIRDQMVKGCQQFLDGQLIDPNVAEVSNVSPASITNSISPESPSGTGADAFRYDLSVLMAAFTAANQDPTMAVLLLSATVAMGLSLMVNALGQPEFPSITVKGGTIMGLPVIVSETVSSRMILVKADDILFADDGGISVDVSEQAAVEMDTVPIIGEESPITGAVLKSLWQNNLVGLRVERYISWKRARTTSVKWTNGVAYAPAAPTP